MRIIYAVLVNTLFILAAILWVASVFTAVVAYPKKDTTWFIGLVLGGLAILSATIGIIVHLWLEYHPDITVKN